jgi:hypothetical protein
MSYVDDADGSSGLSGMYIATSAYKGQVVFPKFKNRTLFRPFGPPTPDKKNIMPTRAINKETGQLSARPKDYSGWITAKQLVRGVGTSEWATFLVTQLGPDGNYIPTQSQRSPYHILYRTWKGMCRRDTKLEALGKGSDTKRASIQPIKTFAIIQGALIEHGGKPMQPPVMPCMQVLPWSAKGGLETLLETETEAYKALSPEQKQAHAGDVVNRFVYWDMLNYDTGKYILLHSNKTGDNMSTAAVDWNGQQGYEGNQSSQELSKYICKAVDCQPLPRTATGMMAFEEQGRLFTPWEQALRFLSDAEMADILVGAFRDTPELLIESFSAYGWLPASLSRGQMVSLPPASAPIAGPPGAGGDAIPFSWPPAGAPPAGPHMTPPGAPVYPGSTGAFPPGFVPPPTTAGVPGFSTPPTTTFPPTPPPAQAAPPAAAGAPDWGAAASMTEDDNKRRLAELEGVGAGAGQPPTGAPPVGAPAPAPGVPNAEEVARVMQHLNNLRNQASGGKA